LLSNSANQQPFSGFHRYRSAVRRRNHLIEWFEKSRDFLFSIPAEIRTLLCREGSEGADVETMLADGARISALQERLGPASSDQLTSHLASVDPAHRSDELSVLSEAVEFFERSIGSLDGIGFGAIVARATRQRAATTTRDVVVPERRRVALITIGQKQAIA
jgi:hypothetical protein